MARLEGIAVMLAAVVATTVQVQAGDAAAATKVKAAKPVRFSQSALRTYPQSFERFRYAAPAAELPVASAAFAGRRAVSGEDVGYSAELPLSLGEGSGPAPSRKSGWRVFVAASANSLATENRDQAGAIDPAFADRRDVGYMSKAQAGLLWRKGSAQASLGYVKRSIQLSGSASDLYAGLPKSDHVAGLSFSFAAK
jgi:hypothetical protein